MLFAVSMPDADRRHVISAIELLNRIGVRVLGTVATNLPRERRGRGGYGYGYGYGYGAAEDRETPAATSARVGAPAERTRRDPALIDELDAAGVRAAATNEAAAPAASPPLATRRAP